MKTIEDVLREYRDRRDAINFISIKVMEDNGNISEYSDITGLHNTKDEQGKWLEFDYDSFTLGKRLHVKLHGHITQFIS